MAAVSETIRLAGGMRPLEQDLIADQAAGAGGAGIGAKALDGVFCFGALEETSMQRAAAAKGAEDPRARVLGMMKAADAHVQAGRLHEAAKEVEESYVLIHEHRFEEGRACAMVLVAKIYARQGKLSTPDQLDEALDLSADAQEKFQKFGSKKCEAAALMALAAVRHALKMHDQGHAAAKEAEKLLEDTGDKFAVAEVFQVVADGFVAQSLPKRAAAMVSKARAIHLSLGETRKAAECQHRLGEIETKGTDRAKAEELLNDALEEFRKLSDVQGEVAVLATLRDYHVRKGRLGEGVAAGQRIVTTHHNSLDAKAEGNALVSLAELLLENKHLDLAAKVLAAAHKVFNSSQNGEGIVKVAEVGATLKNEKLKREVRESIDDNRHFANYPVDPVVELDLAKRVPQALAETAQSVKKGL